MTEDEAKWLTMIKLGIKPKLGESTWGDIVTLSNILDTDWVESDSEDDLHLTDKGIEALDKYEQGIEVVENN